MLPGLELGHRGFQRNASRWAVYRGAPALPARAACLPRPPWVLTLQRQGTVQASVPPSSFVGSGGRRLVGGRLRPSIHGEGQTRERGVASHPV